MREERESVSAAPNTAHRQVFAETPPQVVPAKLRPDPPFPRVSRHHKVVVASTPESLSAQDIELEVLRTISEHTHVHQRDIARIVGTSLGMTNAIVKRLAHKGLISIRKVNNRNIHYVVSSDGLEAIAKRSYRYLKRTIKNVVYYKQAIGEVVDTAQRHGFGALILVGHSDLDFIVEHWCLRLGVEYRSQATPPDRTTAFVVYSEQIPAPHAPAAPALNADGQQGDLFAEEANSLARDATHCVYLQNILAAV